MVRSRRQMQLNTRMIGLVPITLSGRWLNKNADTSFKALAALGYTPVFSLERSPWLHRLSIVLSARMERTPKVVRDPRTPAGA